MASLNFSTAPRTQAPLACIAAAKLGSVELAPSGKADMPATAVPELVLGGGVSISGGNSILRYIGRIAGGAKLYGSSAIEATQIDQWIDYSNTIEAGSGMAEVCAYIDTFLAMRTVLVGYSVTLADLAVWGVLASIPMWDKVRLGGLPHLNRWYNHVSSVPAAAEAAAAHSGRKGGRAAASADAKAAKGGGKGGKGKDGGEGGKEKAAKSTGSFNIDLPGAAEGKVCTRFPPEPSGYLHIGHAKAALMNQYFARHYKGTLIVRFDDTNPDKENQEFVDNIMDDLKVLDVTPDRLTYTSDYFEQMLAAGEKLIKDGHMYGDNTPTERMRAERMDGIESEKRNTPVKENLRVWKEMIAGSEEGLAYCMRLKMDMKNDNKALRDPVSYRCNLTPHHRTGAKFKLYPTYDLACPFVDSHEGVTHALRTSEYKDREAQYHWAQELMGLRKVHVWEFSRLNFVHTVLSKRKLQWFVDQGKVEGWTDPRFPTVQGIRRRGLTVEALKEFILSQGASKNITTMEWDKLWTINKKIIDPVCPRHVAVASEGRVLLTLSNGPAVPEVVTVPRHKKFEGAGSKATSRTKEIWLDQADAAAVKEGEEVTLMDWGNCVIKGVRAGAGGAVEALEGELHLAGDVKKTKLKLTWLPHIADLVEVQTVDFGYLITKKKIEDGDNFDDFVNDDTRFETSQWGDANMRQLKKGEVLQLERKGYFICDQPYVRAAKPIVLFAIPDGREKK